MISVSRSVEVLNRLSRHERARYDTWHALRLLRVKRYLDKPVAEHLERELEQQKSVGLVVDGMRRHLLFWTRPAYKLSAKGEATMDAVEERLREARAALVGAAQDERDALLETLGYEPAEFLIMKSLLLDKRFDSTRYGIFTRRSKIGDYMARKEKRGRKIEHDSENDVLGALLIADVLSDGELDLSFGD